MRNMQAELEVIIRSPNVVASADKIVAVAQELGYSLKNSGATSTQMRGIFSTVRKIELNWKSSEDARRSLRLLKPRIAYQAKRHETLADLANVLISAIDLVTDEDRDRETARFRNFVDFCEAIMAYHVAAGGR